MTNFRFNIIYFALLLALVAAYFFLKNTNKQAHLFYGVADNQETEITHEEAIRVQQILVQAGKSVKKGTPLLIVERADLPLKQDALSLDAEDIQVKQKQNRIALEAKILELEAQKMEKKTEFEAKMSTIRAEADYNKWLSQDLKTLQTSTNKEKNGYSASETRLQALESEKQSTLAIFDTRINHLKAAIRQVEQPYLADLAKIKNEQNALHTAVENQTILAPSDGIVGNVRCRVGENKAARDVLISFYEKSPNLVVGYVQETLLVHVKEGDSVQVQSHIRENIRYHGIISGLGYRVVEIPERLRRFPEIKTYGREVLIRIPSENEFLQNEKVRLFIQEH